MYHPRWEYITELIRFIKEWFLRGSSFFRYTKSERWPVMMTGADEMMIPWSSNNSRHRKFIQAQISLRDSPSPLLSSPLSWESHLDGQMLKHQRRSFFTIRIYFDYFARRNVFWKCKCIMYVAWKVACFFIPRPKIREVNFRNKVTFSHFADFLCANIRWQPRFWWQRPAVQCNTSRLLWVLHFSLRPLDPPQTT